MMKKAALLMIAAAVFLSSSAAQEKARAKLPEHYKKWVEEEVGYIITPREKDVFLKLGTDRERNIFIEAFWRHRDPTPGTPRNEFKEEHYQRWNYANEFFGRGTPRPGWMTDRGRVYIILGPPQNIETYDQITNVFPTEIWFYLGDPALGLPTAFHIIFFKKEGTGEYVLYSPVDHGPQSLISDYMGDARDAVDAFQRLAKLSPNLASQSLTLIPSERVFPGQTSLASITLLNNVFSSPIKKVEDTYAAALLKYKDIIEVDYSANYIGSDAVVKVIHREEGFFLVQYSIEPKKISVDAYGDEYNAHFELDGRISDTEGRTIYQFTKEFPLIFSGQQLKDLEAQSLALQDMFPLAPGRYRFDLLLKNTVSKEFTSLDTELTIPEQEDTPRLSPLILGYKAEDKGFQNEMAPFQAGGKQLLCQARYSFAPRESLFVFFQIWGLTDDLKSHGRLRFTLTRQDAPFLTKTKDIIEYGDGFNFLEEFPLKTFPPDYYRMEVALLDKDGKELAVADEDFEVTTTSDIPRPLVVSKVISTSRLEEYEYVLGVQLLNLGKYKEAYAHLIKAHAKNPAELRYALGLSQSLYQGGEFERIKDVLAPFTSLDPPNEQVLYFLGKSCHALEQYEEAVGHYTTYLSRFGLNLEVLNLLGMAYYRLGRTEEALKALERSLEVNPKQEEVKKLVDSLRQKK